MLKHKKSLVGRRRGVRGGEAGTLSPPHDAFPTELHVLAYSEGRLFEKSDATMEDVAACRGKYKVTWINVVGLKNIDTIRNLGRFFQLHALALEDVLSGHQRPKCEEFKDHIFLTSRIVELGRHIDTKQVSMFLGDDFLVTFQERPGDCLDPTRKRIRESRGKTRSSGPDYLCYALIDTILDDYFPVIEELSDRLAHIDDQVVDRPQHKHVHMLHDLKRDLLLLRRTIWPHREMINTIIHEEHVLFKSDTRIYLRDGYDHTIQLMDLVETYREIASGLSDVYISSMSAKLNDVMKVLTIIATIFMPLSFITGLYGMNFNTSSPWNMPELEWRYGYLFAWGIMLASVAAMLWFFKAKNWVRLPWLHKRSVATE
ncbi:MAG: magnesium/cobalt transporter CorA [Hyphomicrobiaceae bacterium]